MKEAIEQFTKQLSWEPEIQNADRLVDKKYYVLAGMGGSHLAAGLLKLYRPGIPIYTHRSYGLPPYDDAFLKDSLLIASSYSGNTEEVVDFLEEGYSRGYDMMIVTTGGVLLDFAKDNNIPYIQLPDDGIQPRSAYGYSAKALATIVKEEGFLKECMSLAEKVVPKELQKYGEELGDTLEGSVPVFYTSNTNLWIAYNWKIRMNETAKIPAFYNVFPECNHNELTGFDVVDSYQDFIQKFHVVMLKDEADHPRIQKRMQLTEDILEQKGVLVTSLYIQGESRLEKVFNSLLSADWAAYSIATKTGADPENIPIIEELKKKMQE